jgi:hypothetical protein
MLQHLAKAQSKPEADSGTSTQSSPTGTGASLPNLVLAIEEPELYQHPNRQRHLAKILLQLSGGKTPGVAESTQIIYATHSPLFVGLDRINQARLRRKNTAVAGKPKATRIISTSLTQVADVLWKANGEVGERFTEATLLPRLQTTMTPWMSEGFFADVVVLVEGEDDRAAILGVAKAMGHELESSGLSVIPCGGKTNLDRPSVTFQQWGIPVSWCGMAIRANPTQGLKTITGCFVCLPKQSLIGLAKSRPDSRASSATWRQRWPTKLGLPISRNGSLSAKRNSAS